MKSKKIDIERLSYNELQMVEGFCEILGKLKIQSGYETSEEIEEYRIDEFCDECEAPNDCCECCPTGDGDYDMYDDGADYE